MPAAAVIPAPIAKIKVVPAKKLVVGFLPGTVGPPLAGEHLDGPRHLFRRLYLHFIVWSGIRNLYFEEIRVFQACACGEYISME